MKHFLISIFIISISSSLCAGQEKISSKSKLTVHFEKNIEFLGFLYFMAYEANGIEDAVVTVEGEPVNKKDWYAFSYPFYMEYKSTLSSDHLAKAATVANHLWLDYLNNFLLRVPEFPNAEIPDNLDISYYLNFSQNKDSLEAKENAEIFLKGLNQYYKIVEFDSFLKAKKPYYKAAKNEILNTLPKYDFIGSLEEYFGKEYPSYHLIPSLTTPKTMGFGMTHPDGGICNIFGAIDFQIITNPDSLKMGFQNERNLRELSVHEFGHSFINKAWASIPDSLFEATANLFDPIKNVMEDQGYNSWKTSINEHIVRTVELIIAKSYASAREYNQLKEEYLQKRQFIYIPEFETALTNFEQNNLSFEEAVINSMEILRKKVISK